jgi:predicted HNH restriction endonuclease
MDKSLSKFENIFDKVMQASMTNQKNTEASIRKLKSGNWQNNFLMDIQANF